MILTKEELVKLIALHICDSEQVNEQSGQQGTNGVARANLVDLEMPADTVTESRDLPSSGVSLSDWQMRLELAKIQLEQTKIQAQVEQARIDAEVGVEVTNP
ncbi:hypothetical protein Pcinc_002113 [Petrolisthes cinctipes]|uniref:Uncharacterized protein n=1 Tax=Petrolisthes cinctipes TaxID=88211 RepID=A0AAE1GM03_PETCI|nr:hypothetical protein Pcinc_002113 [Petrolisthes cinctipes]